MKDSENWRENDKEREQTGENKIFNNITQSSITEKERKRKSSALSPSLSLMYVSGVYWQNISYRKFVAKISFSAISDLE